MLHLRDLMAKDFIQVDENVVIQEGVALLLKQSKSVLVYEQLGVYYYLDREAFLKAIQKGMDTRHAKIITLGKKGQTFSSDTPLFKVVEKMQNLQKKGISLILVTKSQELIGTISLSQIRHQEILRANIAKDIYRKMEEKNLIGPGADKADLKMTEKKEKWDEFATELKGLLKIKDESLGQPQEDKNKPPKIGLLYNSIHILHKSEQKSPENPKRLLKVMSLLQGRADVFNHGVDLISKFSPISENEILLVHDRNYLDFIKGYCEKGGGFLGDSTYLNYNTVTAASFAIGAAIKSANLVTSGQYDIAWALMRPPGHHASTDRYGGFCLFNSAAITARYLQKKKGKRKILILDWDGHAANGTQSIFYSDDTVMLISLHQDPKLGYPHSGFIQEIGIDEGRGYNVNIVMPPEASDDQYAQAFEEIVKPLADKFQPDFVIGCNGFDAHFEDSHTNLGMTSAGYNQIGRFFRENFFKNSIIITEGGYHDYNGLVVVSLIDGILGRDLSINKESKQPRANLSQKKTMEKSFKKNLAQLKSVLRDIHPEL